MGFRNRIRLLVYTFIASALIAVSATTSTTTMVRPEQAAMHGPDGWIERPLVPGSNLPYRTSFGSFGLAQVMGWPSKGGYLILECDGVELDFLGLDRFEEVSRSTDPKEEDTHCERMRKLGPKWWASSRQESKYDSGRSYLDRFDDDVKFFGWPSSGGGVWALLMSADDATERGVAKIYNARTMDERCQWIEKLGGTFYANPDDCPHLDLDGKLEWNTTEESTSHCQWRHG